MAKRTGLPKKYAKMGFKRGWAAYKKSKKTTTRRVSTRRATPKRRYTMARRRRTYRRAARRAVGGINTNAIMKGVIAGAGATVIKKFINVPFADDLAVLGVGVFMKDKTLQTIGAVGLGSDLVGQFGGAIGLNGGAGGGGYIG